MKLRFLSIALAVLILAAATTTYAQTPAAAPKTTGAEVASQIIEQFTAKERKLVEMMNNFRPLIDSTCSGVMMTFVGPVFGCAAVEAAIASTKEMTRDDRER